MIKFIRGLGAATALALVASLPMSCANTDFGSFFNNKTVQAIGKIISTTALNSAAARIGSDDPLIATALAEIIVEINNASFGSADREMIVEDVPSLSAEADQLLADMEATLAAAPGPRREGIIDGVLASLAPKPLAFEK